MKIALVGSSGGHLTHMYLLKKFWENEDRFWVTFDKTDAKSILKEERFYPCYYPTNRNVKNTIRKTRFDYFEWCCGSRSFFLVR